MGMKMFPESVASARRNFFQHGEPVGALVPDSILRSWRRCADHGLDTARLPRLEPLTSAELRQAAGPSERLRRLSRPELEALYSDALATGCVVILTDADGLILESLGSADFAARAAQVALRPGVPWAETTTGTNAVGTALVEGRPIAVHGGEHYFEPHAILSCSAAPIYDPFGRLVGALDLSGPAAVDHRHALGLVQLAIEQIEHRFFEDGFGGREVLRFQADPALVGTSREGIFVFEDDRLVAANRVGLALVDRDWTALGTDRTDDLFRTFSKRAARSATPERLVDVRGRALFGRLDGARTAMVAGHALPRPAPRDVTPVLGETVEGGVRRAVRLLDADVPILIHGETGTGKEMIAREIHHRCGRSAKPFIAVNCAAIPESLIESELFGYEEGAFTGARRQGRKGLLREADGGVLFLDEIGDMPLALQARLLRVLQEREVVPLGGGRPVKVDFALVCATHRDLKAMAESGAFRADLYFRIAHDTLELPALRALPDRLPLVRELWRRLVGDGRFVLSADCEARLAAFSWPGNFRQLAGTLKVLAALAEPDEPVSVAMLPAEIARVDGPVPTRSDSAFADPKAPLARDGSLEGVTIEHMRRTLEACGGNVSAAARKLGINRSTLYRRVLGN
ncbi:sigma-54-dependent Fis family transcriptional regulator [Segnochrobactrum spirostomi]|uniref:Sigma-54-dependent Fis family transcriptional regulator n=1 Tax=Segnochrobactrum spirostomi TaxID=2608987 RepID=A0A6A7Y6X1_9HYPH|nr:sigma-54-dependent Fis family transcriptional regulator [Segnochrobactrum spirostomi]MQT15080.1 sigma-54-dependent Fis family transcriptional regulator [Segnochrobactrum spirostomi]